MAHRQLAMQRARGIGKAPRHVPVLAIAGDSAAGKTTLTSGLTEALGPDRLTSVCVDDYHRYDRAERAGLEFTPLHPKCNYIDIMEQHLQLLALGEPILKPVYDHATGMLLRPVHVRPSEFVVVEGLLPLSTKLARACFDVTVYLDPPEEIRRAWKVARDTKKRGYTVDQVHADLLKREPESAAFIRPQRAYADIVVQFAPIAERGESLAGPLSATVLLRPTIAHPDLSDIVDTDNRQAMHLKMLRDEDGKPVDALHIHAYAPRELTRKVEEAIWSRIDTDDPVPECLGRIEPGKRSEPLAIIQLILLYHLLMATQH